MPSESALCRLCGEPMPEGEEMFFYHGFSIRCPKPPLKIEKPIDPKDAKIAELEAKLEKAKAALQDIKHLGKMELLCDPADWEFDAESAYAGGSHNAFCQAAEHAQEALKAISEGGEREGT